jgi:hypothetical protein
MAITKFKISRSPLKSSILIEGVEHVINQEYSIAKQADIDIVTTGVGLPYDSFGYKLGSNDGNWSNEVNAVINVNVDAGTPVFGGLALDIAGNDITDVTASFVFDQYTDRIKFLATAFYSKLYGIFLINDVEVLLGDVYFISDIVTLKFLSTHSGDVQGATTSFRIQPENHLISGLITTIDFISTANLHCEINGQTTITATLTTV